MNGPTIRNRPYGSIRIGDTASIERTVTRADIKTFAAVSGDLNPTHVDDDYMRSHGDGRLLAHSMFAGALISSLLGNELPGPGTEYVSQDLRFLALLHAEDSVTASVRVVGKRDEDRLVVFECECRNDLGELLAQGRAEVIAPAEQIELPRPTGAKLAVQTYEKFAQLMRFVRPLPSVVTAVAHPCSEAALESVVQAMEESIIEPILVGPAARIQALADTMKIDISRLRLEDVPHSHAAAARAVALVRAGEAQMLMKGSLHTDELLSEVVKRDTGLRTARRLSHVFVMDVPTYPKPLIITDAAINIYPTLEEKVDIVQNAIDFAHALGIQHPKVAILSAIETINAKIPSTVEAAALCKMAERGQIVGGLLDGPLAMDNAISKEAAQVKGIRSEVAGDPDILLVPDLEAGNVLAKLLSFSANAESAGVVLGARVPIVLTSRADSVRARLASCALGSLVVHWRRTPQG